MSNESVNNYEKRNLQKELIQKFINTELQPKLKVKKSLRAVRSNRISFETADQILSPASSNIRF